MGSSTSKVPKNVSFAPPLVNRFEILDNQPSTSTKAGPSSSVIDDSVIFGAVNSSSKQISGRANTVFPSSSTHNPTVDRSKQLQQEPKQQKVALVIATHTTSRQVMSKIAACKKADGSDIIYSVRIRGDDVKVNPASIADRDTIIKYLKDTATEFYTHTQKKAGMFVTILRSLPPVDTKDVADALAKEYDLAPDMESLLCQRPRNYSELNSANQI